MDQARRALPVALAVAVSLGSGSVWAQTAPPVEEAPVAAEPTAPPVPAPGAAAVAPEPASPAVVSAPAAPVGPPPEVRQRFRAGRIVSGFGTAIGLVGSGLTLSSIIVTSVVGLDSTERPVGPALACAGSSATGLGVILSATGLGLQHSALAQVGADPGRGLYAAGTLFGILGLLCVGTSYFFGLTDDVENTRAVSFGVSIAGSALLTLGGALYLSDSAGLSRAYRRLTTF
jgi:hypothetical protein